MKRLGAHTFSGPVKNKINLFILNGMIKYEHEHTNGFLDYLLNDTSQYSSTVCTSFKSRSENNGHEQIWVKMPMCLRTFLYSQTGIYVIICTRS